MIWLQRSILWKFDTWSGSDITANDADGTDHPGLRVGGRIDAPESG